ncbi:DNA replication licensing factor MCM3 [Spironucleus salmonicida]|uniref:DNA replication licensing factor MCM3 n=1 Tax=Spironucleus salmonicida TaxID=348837 RepID=V6M0N2_9EUKA|nr:DNA replication licensing factor MCM3 [Spironucleus salmonicida]|eukprot:EST46674.1 MCM domain-containing protein [Spironucleus salmonicida]
MQAAPQLQAEIADFMRAAKLQQLVTDTTLNIPINLLTSHSHSLYTQLIQSPTQFIPTLQSQISSLFNKEIDVNFTTPLLEDSLRNPRTLKSEDFLTFRTVQGIIKKIEAPMPKIQQLVTFKNDAFETQQFSDPTIEMNVNQANSFIIRSNNEVTRLYGLSTFKVTQKLYLQDFPELVNAKMPKTIMCIVNNSTVDKLRPGDRVQLTGVFIPSPHQNDQHFNKKLTTSGFLLIFGHTAFQIANTKTLHLQPFLNLPPNTFLNILAASFSPSLFTPIHYKQALILQLLSQFTSSSTFRSTINILLAGPPGSGKSQFLRNVTNLAHIKIQTSAKNASAAGLTAAVINNQIEAGAFVLADSGILTIDEFDKMSQNDRNSVHEAMEQQTISINKSNIHLQLNCRCCVLGGCNFVFKEYNDEVGISENLGMPDSLVSRFDLIFRLEDLIEKDRKICEQVFKNRGGGEREGENERTFGKSNLNSNVHTNQSKNTVFGDIDEGNFAAFQEQFEPFYNQLQQQLNTPEQSMSKNRFLLQNQYMKDIIQQCKYRQPKLTIEINQLIANLYSQLRYNSISKNILVTARVLESLIRLSMSAAKLNKGDFVTVENVNLAYKLIRISYFNETEKEAEKHIQSEFQLDKLELMIEVFTDFCLEKEGKFLITDFKKEWKKQMKLISITVRDSEFDGLFDRCLEEVEGVYKEGDFIFM